MRPPAIDFACEFRPNCFACVLRTPYAMEAGILRPLLWFGLLEHRSEKMPGDRFCEHHFYRKAALFDRLLAFDVAVDSLEGARH